MTTSGKRCVFALKETEFANVDLDIISKVPLDNLVAALGSRVLPLYVGRNRRRYPASLELPIGASSPRTADSTIRRLAALIDRLPPTARALWDSAQSRTFNIGINGGLGPRAHEIPLQAKTIAEVARLGGCIAVTIYGAEIAEDVSMLKASGFRTGEVKLAAADPADPT